MGRTGGELAGVVAVVPCSKEKIWDVEPELGAVPAGKAYLSEFHRLTRRYAQKRAARTLILSAKHGFLDFDELVPGPYDVTFARPGDPVIGAAALAAQVREKGLERYEEVLVVCESDYEQRVRRAFAGLSPRIVAPLHGLDGIGEMLRLLKATVGRSLSRRR
jgi:hypothetical protein